MNLKSKTCTSCGARLTYNHAKHKYECEYCGASYTNEKDTGVPNPRVELTPDDLKKVTDNMKSTLNTSHVLIKVFSVIFFIIFFFSIITFFVSFINISRGF